jgi:gluconolactonase
MGRRSFLGRAVLAAGAAAMAPRLMAAERDWSAKEPVRYPDPDIIALDKRFEKYKIGNTSIRRLWTGALWAEGCAWNAGGRYLVWSDIPNNRQMRWLDEDGHVSEFRKPSNNTNGSTFDFEGRMLCCEHDTRRVVRFEHNGQMTVLADKWNGKPLNSPNDIVVHPDGGVWFTDPAYGIAGDYEGHKAESENKKAVYRIDPASGVLDMVNDEAVDPNGLCFSPDYKRLYIVDTGIWPRTIDVCEVVDGKKLRNRRPFCSMPYKDKFGSSDGIRADVDGNIWSAAGWGGPGYDGVHVFTSEGERIGMILLPETCANLCFGGPKRNRLFMAASQSLYAVYVGTRGAHIT